MSYHVVFLTAAAMHWKLFIMSLRSELNVLVSSLLKSLSKTTKMTTLRTTRLASLKLVRLGDLTIL